MRVSETLHRQDLLKLAKQFQTKKHLGQHFLVDPEKLASITRALDLSSEDEILEIGPGLGFLTQFLLATGAQVTAVELDSGCVQHLTELNLANLRIIHGDILKYDLRNLNASRLKVVGNIPYKITAAILAHLLGEIGQPAPWLNCLDCVVLTVQHEVALRFVATPGTKSYSQATILSNYFSTAYIVETIPPESFYPAPEVTSAVVRFVPHKTPAVHPKNPRLLRQIIQAGFRQRRKMFKNTLNFLNLPPQALKTVFDTLQLDPQIRAERLSLTQFATLTDTLEEVVNHYSPQHA